MMIIIGIEKTRRCEEQSLYCYTGGTMGEVRRAIKGSLKKGKDWTARQLKAYQKIERLEGWKMKNDVRTGSTAGRRACWT